MKLLIILGLVGYGIGVWKFWKGYSRTNFTPGLPNKVLLSLGWPVLVFNGSYRRNFRKALK